MPASSPTGPTPSTPRSQRPRPPSSPATPPAPSGSSTGLHRQRSTNAAWPALIDKHHDRSTVERSAERELRDEIDRGSIASVVTARAVRCFIGGRALNTFGRAVISATVFWELYQRTRDPLVLAGVGLIQVVPVVLLFVPSG